MKDTQESGALGFSGRAPREKNVIVLHLLGGSELLPQCHVCVLVTSLVIQRTHNRLDSRFVGTEGFSESCKKTQLD